MAVREFTDSAGVIWRAWDVTPEQMHAATRLEPYMIGLAEGWLAFESASEKRRLPAPYPREWSTFPLTELEALCRSAAAAPERRGRFERRREGPGHPVASGDLQGPFDPVAAANEVAGRVDDAVVSGAERTFISPRGRSWTVRTHECTDRDGQPSIVLRFTADDLVVDLDEWPVDWRRLTAQQFAMLLLDAKAPRKRTASERPPRRREDGSAIL